MEFKPGDILGYVGFENNNINIVNDYQVEFIAYKKDGYFSAKIVVDNGKYGHQQPIGIILDSFMSKTFIVLRESIDITYNKLLTSLDTLENKLK